MLLAKNSAISSYSLICPKQNFLKLLPHFAIFHEGHLWETQYFSGQNETTN